MSSIKLTELQLSGIAIPARSDDTVSVKIAPISEAADLRRTVNGDLVNLARSVFQKYAVSISGSGINLPALAPIWPGQYVELLAPDPISITPAANGMSASWNRAAVGVHGRTADGRRVEPTVQPPSPLPIGSVPSSERMTTLRQQWNALFPEPVMIVFARPVLACLLTGWSTDSEDASKEAAWSLDLQEA